jgi:hypothetical protein
MLNSLFGVVGGSFNSLAALLYVLSRAAERVAAERAEAGQRAHQQQRPGQSNGCLHVDVPFSWTLSWALFVQGVICRTNACSTINR